MDEPIEAVALAIAASKRDKLTATPEIIERVWTGYKCQAQAALAAAEPFIQARVDEARREALEEAAEMAEQSGLWDYQFRTSGKDFAAAIRALGEKKDG